MKAKLLFDCDGPNPEYDHAAAVAAQEQGRPYDVPHSIDRKKGEVIEHRDAWKLVRFGMAEPADDECKNRCGMTPEQISDAKKRQERLTTEDIVDEAEKQNDKQKGTK